MRITTLVLVALVCVVIFTACGQREESNQTVDSLSVVRVFEQRESGVQVSGDGVISRILTDDKSGSPHQRFIVRVSPEHTVLIQHNIELAPRIDALNEGDTVSFYGEYVWNAQGGLVHWTHHDPAGRHPAGWLKHKSRTYQ